MRKGFVREILAKEAITIKAAKTERLKNGLDTHYLDMMMDLVNDIDLLVFSPRSAAHSETHLDKYARACALRETSFEKIKTKILKKYPQNH